MAEIRLGGCSTKVALLYLKSLGIFRAVARHRNGGDPGARARWDGDTFVLDTVLGRDGLAEFFASKYRPLPLVSPWNLRSGFHSSNTAVEKIRQSNSERLEQYRQVISKTFCALNDVFGAGSYPCSAPGGDHDANSALEYKVPEKSALHKKKDEILEHARNTLPDDVIEWIDAAFVMTASGKWTAGPILGSGGVDGKTEMSATYMKYVLECLTGSDKDESNARSLVRNALFDSDAALRSKNMIVGPFFPGAFAAFATGPPSDDQYTLLNPWDYILAMEGMTFFGGGVSRRGERGYAAFPFSVKLSHAGFGTASGGENGDGKDSAEVWFPLWGMPATYGELRHVFYEGLVQSNRMPTTGVGMAVALANYGAMRGISAFERYGMFKRKGRDHHLVSVGRIHAGDARGGGRVIQEIEPWLDAVRAKGEQLAAKKGSLPSSVESALRSADDAILWYCQDRSPQRLQDVLVALGRLDRQIATSPRLKLRPLGRLSGGWLVACNTHTPEYRLAASLASIYAKNYPVRCNLEPVTVPDDARKPVEWHAASTTVAWGRGGLVRNLVSVLGRRCVDGRGKYARGVETVGVNDIPDGNSATRRRDLIVPLGSRVFAPVADIVRFVEGDVDDALIHDLLLPLSAIQYREETSMNQMYDDVEVFRVPRDVPESYISLKANFPPVEPRVRGTGLVFESALIGLLRAGNGARAVDVAKRRLRISGYHVPPPPRPRHQHEKREGYEWVPEHSIGSPSNATSATSDDLRLCASLLFPVRHVDMDCLVGSLEPTQDSKKRQISKWMDCDL